MLEDVEVTSDRLRDILESLGEPVTAVDRDWRFTFINDRAAKTLPEGLDREEAMGETPWEIFPDLLGTEAEDELRGAMQTREPTRFVEREGDAWWETRVYPVEDGLSILQTEVTETKRAQREAERQRRNLELAEEIAGLGHWEWIVQDDVVHWSDNEYEIYGRARETFEPTFEGYLDCVHPDDRGSVQDELEQALDACEPFDFENRVVHPDGEIHVVRSQGRVETNEDGNPVRMFGVSHDVTEQRRRETEIERAREDLEIAERVANLGHWTWDPQSDEVVWSRGCYDVHGQDPETFGPSLEGFIELIHPEDRERVQISIEEALSQRTGLDYDYRIPLEDEERIVYAQARIETEDGDVSRFLGTVQDVTEARRREEELREAKQAAEQASKAKSAFLSNTSHEIRTPMNAVTGMTSLLLDTDLDEEQLGYVRTIRDSSDHLLTLINDILDLSKVEAGQLEIVERPAEVRQVVEEAIELVSQRAADKGLELGYLIDGSVPTGVETDPGRLRQILVNLLGNAVKFTDEGEVRVDVSLAEEDGKLRFDVQDTGMGIPEEDQAKLFQSFSQVDPSTSRRHQGTGLGLAICRRLSELMGGEIAVDSEPGVGSTFTFTIEAEPAEVEATRPEELSPVSLRGQRVLVVDDNETNREIVEHYLEAWEIEVVLFADPEEALAWLEEGNEADLALLDQQMPGMDGIELARRIQEDHSPEDLPIAILTSMVQDPVEVEKAGVELAAYLSKPIKPSDLYDELLAIFEGRIEEADLDEVERERQLLDPEMAERLPLQILVVEDNPVSQQVAEGMLGKLGYDADLVGRGEEALEALESVPYDAILMDVQMPGMDGYETTVRIRKRFDADRQPRVIALTAHAGPEAEREAEEAGMDDYVSKPISAESLVSALEKAVPLDLDDVGETIPSTEDEPVSNDTDPSKEPLLDEDKFEDLRSILGDGEEGVGGLVDTFIDRTPETLDDLDAAAEAGDLEKVSSLAHKVKGEASTLGAKRLSSLAKKVEDAGRAEDLDDPVGAADQLREAYEATVKAFREREVVD